MDFGVADMQDSRSAPGEARDDFPVPALPLRSASIISSKELRDAVVSLSIISLSYPPRGTPRALSINHTAFFALFLPGTHSVFIVAKGIT